jgi:SAM-dependent methyltransferase
MVLACPICNQESPARLVKDGCEFHECPGCEFLFHRSQSRPTQSYSSDYWEMERAEAERREREESFLRAVELIYLSAIPVRRILDFGCGMGETVALLRKHLGIEAVGVDPFAQFVPSSFLHKGSLKELRTAYPQGYFDAIYSIEVFEHLEDPRGTLADLVYLLNPGGKILINTGTREFLAECDPAGDYIDPNRRGHISIFALKSFATLAAEFGLQAAFFAARRYVVTLGPVEAAGQYPNPENVAAFARVGEWFGALLRDYIKLVFLEHESQVELAARAAWAFERQSEVDRLGVYIRQLQADLERANRWALERDGEVGKLSGLLARLLAAGERATRPTTEVPGGPAALESAGSRRPDSRLWVKAALTGPIRFVRTLRRRNPG